MKYYLLLGLAVLLGQVFVAASAAWVYQRANENITYWKALQLYFKKEIGTFILIMSFTVLVMFVLSDWMDLTINKIDLLSKEKLTKFETAQSKFRTVAALYGMLAQWIALLVYKGGRNAVMNYGKKQGVDIEQNMKQ